MIDGPYMFLISERQSIYLKHILNGTVTIPSKEKMLESYNSDIQTCREGNMRYLYQIYDPTPSSLGFKLWDEMQAQIPEGTYKGKPENFIKKQFGVLYQLLGNLMKGDF